MRVAVIPPLVTGEDPGVTPKIQQVSAVVSPSPDATAFSALAAEGGERLMLELAASRRA